MTKRIDIKELAGKNQSKAQSSDVSSLENIRPENPKKAVGIIRKNLLKSLRELCQFYYLPFTTKFFSGPDEIILDFLKTLSQKDQRFEKPPLTASEAVSAIVPTFLYLTNYSDWRTGEIPSLKVLTNLGSKFVNHIHSIEEAWSEKDPKLTGEIMAYLNKPRTRNGRLKVRITLSGENRVKINYNKDEKMLEYAVPSIIHNKWLRFFGIATEQEAEQLFDIFDLNRFDQIHLFPTDFPKFEEAEFTTSQPNTATEDRKIAETLFPAVLKHSLYINEDTDLLYIFSNNTEVDLDNRDVGLGGMFILINKKLLNGKRQEYSAIINYFSRLTDALSSRIITYYYAEEIVNIARKAATAQVMLRNSAHSIASHVISKMILDTDVLDSYNYDSGGYQPYEELRNRRYEAEETIAWFHSYLRSRMDFLADMATTVPFMEVSKFLKADVIAGLDKNQILLNYISGVSDFKYALKVFDERTNKGQDIPISIPNDILGYHGIYIILENIIRNTAKHGSRGENQDFVNFSIKVKDCKTDDSLNEVWVYDDCKVKGIHHLSAADKSLYEKRTNAVAPDSLSKIDWLVFKQNIRIDDPILDPKTNALRNGAWGMIEMRVAAAYLRKISSDDLDHKLFKLDPEHFDQPVFYSDLLHNRRMVRTPNIIKAAKVDDSLAYVFHVMKPKELLVIDEQGEFYDQLKLNYNHHYKQNTLDFLKDFGIRVLHDDAHRLTEDRFDQQKIYPYPYLLVLPRQQFDVKKYLYNSDLFQGHLPHYIFVAQGKLGAVNSKWVIELTNDELLHMIAQSHPKTSFKPNGQENIAIEAARLLSRHKLKAAGIDGLVGNDIAKDNICRNFNKYILGESVVNQPLTLCLDHHGSGIDYVFGDGDGKVDHYEAFPSSVRSFVKSAEDDLIDGPGGQLVANPDLNLVTLCNIVSGVFSKIVIIDERIQHAFVNTDFHGDGTEPIKRKKLYEKANIFVPESVDLNKTDFDPNYEDRILKELQKIGGLSKVQGIDYIVIHLGVVEKILATQGIDKGQNEIEGFVKNLNAVTDARIVITSGRGRPENLPDAVPFIAFSAISQYTLETPFKTYLFQSLKAARSNI